MSWLRNRTASSLHLRESKQISDFRFQILVSGSPNLRQISDFRFQSHLSMSEFWHTRVQISDFRFQSLHPWCLQISDFRFQILLFDLNGEFCMQISDFRFQNVKFWHTWVQISDFRFIACTHDVLELPSDFRFQISLFDLCNGFCRQISDFRF